MDDQFCGDCGNELGRDCPACGHHVGLGDFCEACGHWMHEGKCRFCYAVLPDGASFCEDCGGNQAGLVCARCNTRSFFDFCGPCGTALSERALASLQMPAAVQPALADALAEMQAAQQAAQSLADEPVLRAPTAPAPAKPRLLSGGLAQTLRTIDTSAPAAVVAPGPQMRTEVDQDAQHSQAAFEQIKTRRLSMSERLRAARQRVQQLMEEAGRRTFEDGQQARVHFMGLRQRLIDDGYVPRAWRCNRYSCEHPAPNDCGAPQFGGVWLIDPAPAQVTS